MIINNMPVGTFRDLRLFVLTDPFRFYSDVLDQWTEIPAGFTCDLESIPVLRGLCRTGGLIHDYFSRIDSDPIVDKKIAADVYKEALIYFKHPKWKIIIKYRTVRIWPSYFHKKLVLDK